MNRNNECGEVLVDTDGYRWECMRPPHEDDEPHASGVEFTSQEHGSMQGMLVWHPDRTALPRVQLGLKP